ncbi:MAG: class I SAM-dependent methyltransferase [Chloroflexota bacterium]|nr:class I SAM-dependent methyltransferase [Chloroflexota bacterium]
MAELTDWDRRYAARSRLFHREPDAALVELATPLPPGRAVDLGAGEGRNSLWLAGRGWAVVAVDSSEVALSRTREAAAARGLSVQTVQEDAAAFLGRGERFHLVVVANMHPTAKDRAALLAAAAAAVAPGGHLFLIGHHLDSFGQAGPPDPERLYTAERLRDAFPGLIVEKLERRERPGGTGGERLVEDASSATLVDMVVWASAPPGSEAGKP